MNFDEMPTQVDPRYAQSSARGYNNAVSGQMIGADQLPMTLATQQVEDQSQELLNRLRDIERKLFGVPEDYAKQSGMNGPATPVPPADLRSTTDRTAQRLSACLSIADMIGNRL